MTKARLIAGRQVRLFTDGRDRTVLIPREFELPGHEAIMRREGDRLILVPVVPHSLLAVLKRLKPIDEDLPEIDDPQPEPVEL